MAKENTHIFFARSVLEHLEPALRTTISEHADCYYLGCVIPDTFFYSSDKSIELISETLHGKFGNPTNEVIFKVLDSSKDMRDIAFILGYITHCALDITLHPIVFHLCGNYYDPDPAKRARAVYLHRHIETCLDVKLGNRLRIYSMIRTRLIRTLKFQEIIARDFCVSQADIRRTLIKQIFINRLFASTLAYRLAKMMTGIGVKNMHGNLGLFYGDVANKRMTVPEHLIYHDIVTGIEKTTSIIAILNDACNKAVPMMEAAYAYSEGVLSKERLSELIPGESLDTGRLHEPTSTVRRTFAQEPGHTRRQ